MRKIHFLLTLVALFLTTSSLWATPPAVNGQLPCEFSVSATQKVYFSQGNLQAVFASANTTTCSWKFAAEQYQCIGNATANKNVSNNQVTTAGTVDLFGWVGNSSSLAAYGINSNNTASSYGNNSSESLKRDWGSTMGSGWRTLTSSEWTYLFNTRTGNKASTVNGSTNIRYAKATVNSICGVIIFPDGGSFAASEFTTVSSLNTKSAAYTTTTCSLYQWQKLEEKGCVFLPAAGARVETSVSMSGSTGSLGYYWSSSPDPSNSEKAYYLTFTSNGLALIADKRKSGLSVRLVKNTNAPTAITAASVTTAPIEISNLAYTGSAQALVNAGVASGGSMKYRLGTSGGYSAYIPKATNAGTYQVYYYAEGISCLNNSATQSINVTIAKADYTPSGSYSVTGNDLSFTGNAQQLVTVSNESDGTIWYKLGDGDWSDQIPTAEEIGTYHIWYKVVPSDAVNYKSTDPVEVIASITIPTVYDVNVDPSSLLTTLYNGGSPTATNLKIVRTIYADDEYNTLCLPFSLDASALAASPLAGFNRLKTFRGAQVTGTAPDLYIDIFVEDATTIEAGIPYLITYPSEHVDIVDPIFNGITVTTTEPSATAADGVTFQGMFAQVHIDPYDAGHTQDYLFVGANSQLYWPSSDQTSSSIKMRGFRAYFIIDRNSITPALAPKGTRARIMDAPKTTTGIENTSATFGGSEKIIENGILYIIRNGVKYNAQGQVVK